MSIPARIAIVGAGWAGLATAVELASAGRSVTVFEASRSLGGRARRIDWQGIAIDNGQHLLIGAYSETLRLMRSVGADPDRLLRRQPLRLEFPGEFLLSAPRLPAPLHTAAALLGAKGLDWREKWAAVRLMTRLRRAGYRIEPDTTVAAWLDAAGTPPRQRRLLWEPLCIAALNTPVADASAQVLATVLRDSLDGARADSDLLLPQVDLSALFPEPAAAWLSAHGHELRRECRVGALQRTSAGWTIGDETFAAVVVAVAPQHLAAIVGGDVADTGGFAWEPIVTSYLRYPAGTTLPGAMLGVDNGIGQWLFDRGRLCGQDGLIAVVISARGRHIDLAKDELEQRIHGEIAALVPNLPNPMDSLTVTEKRATFACRPQLSRPGNATRLPGLWLAGDYTDTGYPATLEGAVRSGVAAAHGLLAEAPTA